MEKEFVPYNLALELKDLGFNEKCLGSWRQEQEEEWFDPIKGEDIILGSTEIFLREFIGTSDMDRSYELCKAPLWQQAFDWFREKYNLICYPVPCDFNRKDTKFDFIINGNMNYRYLSYEEVKLECLKKLIELAKEQNAK